MRKLATIQKVTDLYPIDGKDRIVLAQVMGWTVIVQKSEVKVGDMVVYFEVDSFLPDTDPAFAFLEPKFSAWNGKRGMRLKTMKMSGVLSQGLVLPISAFADKLDMVKGVGPNGETLSAYPEDHDLTEILKIEKWEAEEETRANAGGGDITKQRNPVWPFFLKKTDQTRAQNITHMLAKASEKEEDFEVSVKLDGSSMTVYAMSAESPHFAEAFKKQAFAYESAQLKAMSWWECTKYWLGRLVGKPSLVPPAIYGVCSRNVELDLDGDTHFAEYVRKHKIIEKLQAKLSFGDSMAFQGELIAPSIQKNYEKVTEPAWYVYDVFNIDKQTYLKPSHARLMTIQAELEYVPLVGYYLTLPKGTGPEITQALLELAEGPSLNANVQREGLVYKSNSTPLSFKVVSNSYLLKKG